MNHITWLHLSDFHFYLDKSTPSEVKNYNREVVIKSLLEDLCNYPKEHNLLIDFIVITGDVAYHGSPKEYDLVAKFLDNLINIFGVSKNRLFIVPGNHDIERKEINPYLKPILIGRDDVNGFLTNKEAKRLYFKKFKGYKNFINQYFGGCSKFDYNDHYFWTKKFSVRGTEIGLMGLNSAWNAFGGEGDRGNLLIGEKQVTDAVEQIGNVNLSIAVFHHPLEWLRDDDKNNIKRELAGRCDFVLHGHLHKSGISCELTPDVKMIVIPAGAIYENRSYSNSYNILSINRNTNKAILHLRRYSDNLKKWQNDNDTFINAPTGICEIDLTFINPFINFIVSKATGPPQEKPPIFPLKPYFAHPCPLEKYWVGREKKLQQLTEYYQNKEVRVVSLIGFGGMGKSALARQWLEKIQPDGVFWWCFYHEPSLDAFTQEALAYLSGGQFKTKEVTSSQERVRVLLKYLSSGRFILVMDGLEEMQIIENKSSRFGEMKEVAFTDLLRGWAEGTHHSLSLITSRYQIKDLEPYEGQRYRRLSLEQLSLEDALKLMCKCGVVGEKQALYKVAHRYNCHALSLKLIASYLKEYYKGDISCSYQIPFSALKADKKVNGILRTYTKKLDIVQSTFMSLFSIFRRSVDEDILAVVFRQKMENFDNYTLVKLSDFEFQQNIRHLVNLGLINEDKNPNNITYSTHPLIQNYYYEHLKDKIKLALHRRVAQYYKKKAHPSPITIDDLTYAMESFYHIIKTKDYEQAYRIYREKINIQLNKENYLLNNSIGAYELDLNLISSLFSGGDINQEPMVDSDYDKSWLISRIPLCFTFLGHLSNGVFFSLRGIQICIDKGDWINASINSRLLCIIYLQSGRLIEGETVARNALTWAKKAKDESGVRSSLARLAYSAYLQGKNKIAERLYDYTNNLEKNSDPTKNYVYSNRGIRYAEFLIRIGKKELAEEVTLENLRICQNKGWQDPITRCYRVLAGFCIERQNYQESEEYMKKLLQFSYNSGHQGEIIQYHLILARFYLTKNNLPLAHNTLKKTLSLCKRYGFKLLEIDSRNTHAKVFYIANQPSLAKIEAQTALSMSSACGYYWGCTDSKEILELIDKKPSLPF